MKSYFLSQLGIETTLTVVGLLLFFGSFTFITLKSLLILRQSEVETLSHLVFENDEQPERTQK